MSLHSFIVLVRYELCRLTNNWGFDGALGRRRYGGDRGDAGYGTTADAATARADEIHVEGRSISSTSCGRSGGGTI